MPESNIPTRNQPDPANLCVDICCLHDSEWEKKSLAQMVVQMLHEHGIESAEISVAIVSDQQIQQLNRDYLQHDYVTDVLSFDFGSDVIPVQLAGEVIVSADTAARCAREHGIAPYEELSLYVIHGTLHLLGYDDKEEMSRRKMRRAEARYAEAYGLQYRDPDQCFDSREGVDRWIPE